MTGRRLIRHGEAVLSVRTEGSGPVVVLIPSAGRSVEDFADLATRLADAGFCAVLPEPRGIGTSNGPLGGEMTLLDLAADIEAVIEAYADAPVTVVGHAFGNRVARAVASAHPERVERVVLIAAGGLVEPAEAAQKALLAAFDTSLSEAAHLEAIQEAFFAPGNDPAVWKDGWHGVVAFCQGEAGRRTPVAEWWEAGGKPVLVIQGLSDVVAVPENGHRLQAAAPQRVTVVDLAGAGHALLPEQPEAIAAALIDWLAANQR